MHEYEVTLRRYDVIIVTADSLKKARELAERLRDGTTWTVESVERRKTIAELQVELKELNELLRRELS